MWNNIAKSAEAVFSRWAVKRLCKFMLKKKLGQFILGDIDLDQLDVQLRAGTIQLSDLALNVDFLNQKLGAGAAFVVKEGSIGSLSVTMPWKDRGCEIEVEELELVLAPPGFLGDHFGSETCIPSQVGEPCGSGKTEPGSIENTLMPVSSDVHEGVKTIAKMVKWLLTSFHVKVKKLIVAFDSSLEEHDKNTRLCRTLVLRMSEVQCGTCISEEADALADAPTDNLLGLNMLTNFVKFQGAMLEFLEMDGVESETVVPCASGTTFGEWFSESCPSNGRTPVITGKDGGFSGTLKLRIPWKNGSLNIRKVDADAHIDPLVLRFQPSSIKWLLHLWKIVKDSGKNRMDHMDYKTAGSIHLTTASPISPSTLGSCVTSNKVTPDSEIFSYDFCSPVGKEKVSDALLPESQLISDWVPLSLSKNLKHGVEEEPDFGASVEQFFDCLDEMRNSQSALGNSGMWNWTCSVFTAITAASNLASGSIHIASEQPHIETNLKANVAGISVLFSLLDSEDQQPLSDLNSDKTASSVVHYLSAEFQEILLVLQASSQQIKFKATVENIELTDNFSDDNGVPGTKNGDRQVVMIHKVQDAIHNILPPFPSFARGSCSGKPDRSVAADSPFARTCTDRGSSRTNCEQIKKNNEVKVLLLKTSGCTDFQVAVNSPPPGKFVGASSFSLKLPPVVFWVNFHLINTVLLRLKEFANVFEADSIKDVSASKGPKIKGGSASHGDMKRNGRRYLTALSTEERLRGNIFLPNARIILCFTSENDGDSSTSYCSWNQFIALNVSSPSTASEENVQVTSPVSILGSQKRYSSKTSQSIHLNMGNLDIYLITSPPYGNFGSNRGGDLRQTFSSENILSATNRRGDLSVISMIWQEAPGTGPLIARSAKHLATSEDMRGRSRFVGRGYEFASVTTAKDTEEFSYHARQEMILSSTFILHVHISPIKIKLSSSQYKILHCLSKQAMERLSCSVRDSVSIKNDSSALQTSIIVECGSVDISVSLEPKEITKSSIQNELPGSWESLRLQIKKFHLLSVSNIGGICGSDFLWFSHAEGSLWGSVTEVPNQDFLLISCSNSTMGRGDGEGSNILFSQFAGSDIIHLWDPETCHAYMSITIRCSTIIAIGGRLDWFEAISSFFSLPSPESEQAGDRDLEHSVDNVPSEFSFVLNLVDAGLSYEPYINGQVISKSCDPDLRSMNINEGIHRNYFACLLAASSLKLSHKKLKDHVNSDYKVRVQDLGLLLCAVPWPEDAGGVYGADRLHNVGYVKIAKEAHLEAILRMNCGNGLLWELECSESNIFLETCHDTTSGLIDLATQLQQLFAPDMEESAVHLQARWDNVQKAQESDVVEILNNGPSTSKIGTSDLDTKNKMDVINLMDEICEDAFHLTEHLDGLSVCHEPELCDSDNDLLDAEYNPTARSPKHKLSTSGSETIDILESGAPSQKSFPEFIEGYFLSELSSLPAASKEKKWQDEVAKYKSRTLSNGDAEKVNNGWYGDASFKILEDHVSGVSSHFRPQQLVVEEATTSNHKESDHHGKVRGRVVLKNINVHWRMYAGSDWHKFQSGDQQSPNMLGRDRAACLEFTLSKISCQYEVYPEGGICVSKLKLAIQEINLSDNSKDSPWKMVLGYYQSKDHPRSSSSRAFKLDLEAVRPDPSTPLEEYRLRVAMLPMLLHLHQSQLDFLISFFGGKSSCVDQSPNCYQDVGEPEVSSRNSNFGRNTVSEEALLPFFQKFDLWPVLIRVDYVPCRVDLAALRGGKYVELVNLVPWKGVELQLKHVHAVGLYGWGSVCETVVGEWLEDISQNQIHKLLRGLPPIRSLVAVGSGAAKLVSLPVKNYKRDRRLLKGMQRGTIAFLRSISLEAVGLGVHLAAGAHDILLQAEYILTSVPPSVPGSPQSRTKTNVRSNQPKNVRQGVQQAYESMSDGLGKSASALVRAPLKRYQRGAGAGSALATAVKAAPGAAMAPASAAARAVHCTLLGVRNSLDPEHKKESIEKYLGTSQPRDNTRSINHES